MEDMKKGFKSTRGSGYHMTFKNGLTVSVQWGPGNYCDNRDCKTAEECQKSHNAEVAVWNENKPEESFITKQFVKGIGKYDKVASYKNTDEVADIINKVKNYGKSKVEEDIDPELIRW